MAATKTATKSAESTTPPAGQEDPEATERGVSKTTTDQADGTTADQADEAAKHDAGAQQDENAAAADQGADETQSDEQASNTNEDEDTDDGAPVTSTSYKREPDSVKPVYDRGELHTFTLDNGKRVTVLAGPNITDKFEINQLHPTAVDSLGEPAVLAFTNQQADSWTDVWAALDALEDDNTEDNNDTK